MEVQQYSSEVDQEEPSSNSGLTAKFWRLAKAIARSNTDLAEQVEESFAVLEVFP